MTYNKSKTVSFTPKDALADLIWEHCRTSDRRYNWLSINPQDVARRSLFTQGIIPKEQPWGCGDRSCWEKGKAISVSLWSENVAALTSYAEDRGINRQDVMAAAIADYINRQQHQGQTQ